MRAAYLMVTLPEEVTVLTLQRKVSGRMTSFKTHDRFHFDEAVAVWLVVRKASREWLAQHAPTGELMIGVGGGEFDEHPTATKPRTGQDTCATLVADSLGLRRHPAYRHLFAYLVEHDQGGKTYPFDAGGSVKSLHLKFSAEEVLDWCFMVLDAKHFEQRQYLEANSAISQAHQHLVSIGDKPLKILVVNSGNEQIIKAARAANTRAAVTIQKFPSGHIRIFIDKMAGLEMRPVAREVRRAELQAAGVNHHLDDQALEIEGQVDLDGVRGWYFIYGMLLNGSSTNEDAEVTKLTLEQVTDIVIKNLALKEQAPNPSTETITA